jgi:hypothetical protein
MLKHQLGIALPSVLLSRYLEGWSEADPAKICSAVADGYCFNDPLVGSFSKRSLSRYFDLLRARLAKTGPVRRNDLAFILHGPMEASADGVQVQYWREAPRIGLTGEAHITLTKQGVAGETVAYDLGMACELLRAEPSPEEMLQLAA